ncbi:unnamed protein product [Paramecium primaurelia]|uniref:WD40-repeat-containing domain n=1 Tax=Paramecium primaurelia TaxID=5886 RepID=A0A8S1PEM6_PARPR|nr:unnamed protein product [Paramecium primaurelia]
MDQDVYQEELLENTNITQVEEIIEGSNINYELISKQKQRKWGGALAFNKKGNLLAAASKNDVKIWEFKNGQITNPQFLKGNQVIRIIKFGLQSNFLVAGGSDETMLVWEYQKNTWKINTQLVGHKGRVSAFIISKKDDSIISSSEDGTIKIWVTQGENNGWKCQETLKCMTGQIYSVVENSKSDLLASCSANKIITFWRQQRISTNNQLQWKKFQHIRNEDYGTKICFIDHDKLTWQPTSDGQLYLFQMNPNNNLFELKNKIILGQGNYDFHYFQSIYSDISRLLIVRHKYRIYFIKMDDNEEFRIQQIIPFSTNWNFAALSSDEKYFITWDFQNQEFQVRQKNDIIHI